MSLPTADCYTNCPLHSLAVLHPPSIKPVHSGWHIGTTPWRTYISETPAIDLFSNTMPRRSNPRQPKQSSGQPLGHGMHQLWDRCHGMLRVALSLRQSFPHTLPYRHTAMLWPSPEGEAGSCPPLLIVLSWTGPAEPRRPAAALMGVAVIDLSSRRALLPEALGQLERLSSRL